LPTAAAFGRFPVECFIKSFRNPGNLLPAIRERFQSVVRALLRFVTSELALPSFLVIFSSSDFCTAEKLCKKFWLSVWACSSALVK
jgi:hypothetical protein